MLTKLIIHNYRIFHDTFVADFKDGLTILVGDNETGKSTILEAVNLVLTRRLNGHPLTERDITPHLLNKIAVTDYLTAVKAGLPTSPPLAFIEAYLSDDCGLDILRGTNNHLKENRIGVRLELAFNEEFATEYQELIKEPDWANLVPTEFYSINWRSFADAPISYRGIGIGVSFIDTTAMRLQTGTDNYVRDIVQQNLENKERAALTVAYRRLKEQFGKEALMETINDLLNKKAADSTLSQKSVSLSIDISQKSNWESHLTPHLDDLPFHFVGKGEQSMLKIMLALEMNIHKSNVVLIEEPENHLSFSTMRALVARIKARCEGKQLIIATHSAYVLNKLGLDSLMLLANQLTFRLTELPLATKDYFMRLPGYDTLRLVLAPHTILVEGPSDELVVQKAFFQKHNVWPIEKGVDVINVRGLSFKRFLDIAIALNKRVTVVTDNDGDYAKNITKKYAEYLDKECITICASEDETAKTLEPQIIACNELQHLNGIFGTTFTSKEELLEDMSKEEKKTEYAVRLFESTELITMPKYIDDAVA